MKIITILLFAFISLENNTDMLTGVEQQKEWYLSSMTPDNRCQSAQDDTWIFRRDGSFEYKNGSVTLDKVNRCGDLVNLIGQWELTNNDTFIKVIATHEKDHPTNSYNMTLLAGNIEGLTDGQLIVKITDTDNPGTQYVFEFRTR